MSNIRIRLGMSATPERKDKMEQMLYSELGSMIYRASAATNVSRKVEVRPIFFEQGKQKVIMNRATKKPNFMSMSGLLTFDNMRNNALKYLIGTLLDQNRSILAFADRVDHLKKFTDWVKMEYPEKKAVHYLANLPRNEQVAVDRERHDWVAATYRLFSKA